MLVLALDTATTRITVGVVELLDGPRTLARVDREGARAHAELLAPAVDEALRAAGVTRHDLDALVCGVGPGPFTGLRVGMVTAAAFGDALGRPVHGAGTHEALLHDATEYGSGPSARLAVTDARRREVYWAHADAAGEVAGPAVSTPADLAAELGDAVGTLAVGDAAPALAALVPGLRVVDHPGPSPAALVAVATPALRASTATAVSNPLVPLYLRRPDAVPPGAPKAVRR